MKKRGFTLIELLVVISIISLLSTVVMASLNQARTKAQIATIQTDLQSIKTQAELSYSKMGDYSLVQQEIDLILKHINANGGTVKFISSYNIANTEGYKRYGVSVRLNSDPSKSWTVSDSGNVAVWNTTDTNTEGYSGSQTMGWTEAKTACEISGGRLPTVEELKTVWDVYGAMPLDMQPAGLYWSSTLNNDPALLENGYFFAWVLAYEGSILSDDINDDLAFVRCVH